MFHRGAIGSLAACALASLAFAVDPLKPEQPAKPVEEKDKAKPAEIRLGLNADPLPAKRAADLGLGKNVGLVVSSVDANTPAAQAGMKKGDILTKIGDRDVPNDLTAFRKVVQDLPKDEPLPLVLFRDGVRTALAVGPLAPVPPAGGRLDNQQKPVQGRLDNQPASEGTTNFNVMAAAADQDGFRVFASGEGVSYDVRGRFRNGKRVPTAIKITDDGKVIADVTTLDKVPAGHKEAVSYLLGAVSNK